ncbi:hypothetical protein NliqN6_3465 [Naganishia liquefaciens]|uniref:Uncharacterized protein n=1 Tax=Naganishia liquefaciens TaxID=104408 RepID=A0A8H3TUD1_9TREE|nr:hypothetical protein NliqN6_3465 [Naganishia liquefaciens]
MLCGPLTITVTDQKLLLFQSQPSDVDTIWSRVVEANRANFEALMNAYQRMTSESKSSQAGEYNVGKQLLAAFQFALLEKVVQLRKVKKTERKLINSWKVTPDLESFTVHVANLPDPSIVSSKTLTYEIQNWTLRKSLHRFLGKHGTELMGRNMNLYWAQVSGVWGPYVVGWNTELPGNKSTL